MNGYVGRFAPSPTGPLHAGSLVAALASWLDARAHGGQWLVRMEDVDTTRCLRGMAEVITRQLSACGLNSDLPVLIQSQRSAIYQHALSQLIDQQLVYPCGCSRSDIAQSLHGGGQNKLRNGELVYPGTCRSGLHGKVPRAWRLRTSYEQNWPLAHIKKDHAATLKIANEHCLVNWIDRRLGPQQQDVTADVGDFILKRADGCFAYQLAVVVDDAQQGITDVVRGQDLADNTARQILLQAALHLGTLRYLHNPLVLGINGEKLSKQNGARAVDTSDPLAVLNQTAQVLGLTHQSALPDALASWVREWQTMPVFRSGQPTI